MFIIHFFAWVIALPLFWLGQLLGTIKSPMCLLPLKAAWRLSRDDQMGLAALRRIRLLESPELARLQAAAWLESHPRPGIACFAGALAIDAGDWDDAARLRDLCRELGGDRDGFIDWLDLQLVVQLNDQQALDDFYRRMETRRDLSALVSKTMLDHLLIQSMFKKNWEEVERRTAFLWSIEDSPLAAMALSVLGRRSGKAETLDHFLKNTGVMPNLALYLQALGYLVLGEMELARHALDELRSADAALADAVSKLFAQRGAA